jgi:ABC-type sugar transport system permease subunit
MNRHPMHCDAAFRALGVCFPAVLLMAGVFAAPVAITVQQSLTTQQTGAFALAQYERVVSSGLFLRVGCR